MNIAIPKPNVTRYRAIWISDFHLGTRRAQSEMLLDFFRSPPGRSAPGLRPDRLRGGRGRDRQLVPAQDLVLAPDP